MGQHSQGQQRGTLEGEGPLATWQVQVCAWEGRERGGGSTMGKTPGSSQYS